MNSLMMMTTSSKRGGGGGRMNNNTCDFVDANTSSYQIDKTCESNSSSVNRSYSRQSKFAGFGGEGGAKEDWICVGDINTIEGGNQNLCRRSTTPTPRLREADDEDPPFLPKRSSSLFSPGGGAGLTSATLTLRHSKSQRECNSTASSTLLNPKRISIATSSFWLDHPDMEKFAKNLDFGPETMKTQSVWGASDEHDSDGGNGNGGCVDIWGDPPAVKKGVLLQQREKLWSRWKERYVILTRDYLNCFRKTANVHRSGVTLSEMGSFIFKLRVADVEEIRWENRRSGSVIALVLPQEPRILLRVPSDNTEALHQWYTLLQECIYMSKERRQALRSHHSSTFGKTASLKSNQKENRKEEDLKTSQDSESHSGTGRSRSQRGRKDTETNDEDEDEDYDEVEENEDGTNSSMNEGGVTCDSVDFVPIYSRRSSRESLLKSSGTDLNEFIRQWQTKEEEETKEDVEEEQEQEEKPQAQEKKTASQRRLSNGYAIPADSLLRLPDRHRKGRPESWNHPQSNLFYRTPSIVPTSQWASHGKKEFPIVRAAGVGGGGPFGARSTMIVCPSRITAEVTYIRRM